MSKFVEKLAGALGFVNGDAGDDDREEGYEDFDDFSEQDSYQEKRTSSSYGSSRSSDRQSSYRTPTSSYSGYTGSSYGSGYTGASYGSSYSTPVFGNSSYKTTSYQTSSSTSANGSKVLNLHASVQMEVVVASPESFDEARLIANSIKDNKPVIINLEFVEHSIAQRMTDFLCGCCCAMDGNIQRIADKIYMIAPGNVDFAGDVDIRQSLQTEGLAFPIGTKE